MTRQEKLENKGYKVQFTMSKSKGEEAYCIAIKGSSRYSGTSVTNVYNQIF